MSRNTINKYKDVLDKHPLSYKEFVQLIAVLYICYSRHTQATMTIMLPSSARRMSHTRYGQA
ncbi:MAG: hypothetical protein IPM42_00310 [Saprospiraceae bacterium]|nr:hypothetical protein [Saprospiraceae bacterium]